MLSIGPCLLPECVIANNLRSVALIPHSLYGLHIGSLYCQYRRPRRNVWLKCHDFNARLALSSHTVDTPRRGIE